MARPLPKTNAPAFTNEQREGREGADRRLTVQPGQQEGPRHEGGSSRGNPRPPSANHDEGQEARAERPHVLGLPSTRS